MARAAARRQIAGAIDGTGPPGATPDIVHIGYVPALTPHRPLSKLAERSRTP